MEKLNDFFFHAACPLSSIRRKQPTYRIQERVAAAADHDIRYALLSVTNGMAGRKKNPLEAFARTVNAEELCATSGSAGADGLDVCVEHCERKPHFLARTSQKGACFMLCSVAIAPCSNG